MKPTLVLESLSDGWHIVRCPSCALTFADPQPPAEVIAAYYNGMYSDLAVDFNERKMRWARQSVAGYCAVLDRLGLAGRRLLDLGGGLGYYAKAFEERGFEATLVEQDPVSARFAREVLDLNVVEASAEQYCKGRHNQGDVVFLRHVIEHVPSPDALITAVRQGLAEKGVLIIETDNNASIELLLKLDVARFYLNLYRNSFKGVSFFSLCRKRPFAADPPRHLYAFRLSNLSTLLNRHQITPVKTLSYRLGHPVYWPNIPTPDWRTLKRDLQKRAYAKLKRDLLDFLLVPVRKALQSVGLGAGICIYARKTGPA